MPDNDAAKNIFYWKDLAAMASRAGLPAGRERAAVLHRRRQRRRNPGGLPVGGVTIIDLPNSHLQYAVTWYGLAAGLAGVLAVMLWRPREGN